MFSRKLISISIASALLTSSFAVSANTQKDSAEDSVKAWGPWGQQYSTAAGGELNTNALAFASLGQSETGRNGQNEADFGSTLQGLCEAGQVCAITSFYAHNPLGDEADQFDTGTSGIKTMDNLDGGQVVVYDADGTELYRHARGDIGGQEYFPDLDRTMDLDGFRSHGFAGIDGAEGGVGTGVWFETAGDYWDFGGGAWGHDGAEGNVWPLNGIGGFYVVGLTSALDAVESLVGKVNLTYSGSTFSGTNVTIDLDMGSRTWDASFVAKDVVSDGRYRNTSFSVTGGTISGVNLYATTSQLSDGVSGEVQAAFFGESANQIGGAFDVEKSGMEYTDSFLASRGAEEIVIQPPR